MLFGLHLHYSVRGSVIFGEGDMIYSFFSSISKLLEPKGWGTRFPLILRHLCDYGCVKYKDLVDFALEVQAVKRELKKYTVKDAVYDYEYPDLEIPFDKTEYYNENTSLDAAFCKVDEYGYEKFTNILIKTAKHAFDHNTNLVLATFSDDSFGIFRYLPENMTDVWLKRGRGYYKDEYPIEYVYPYGDIEKHIEIVHKAKDRQKAEYDKMFASLKKKVPIVYCLYFPDGLKSISKDALKRYKQALREAFQTDYFKVVVVDNKSIEENPKKPLDYTKWKVKV